MYCSVLINIKFCNKYTACAVYGVGYLEKVYPLGILRYLHYHSTTRKKDWKSLQWRIVIAAWFPVNETVLHVLSHCSIIFREMCIAENCRFGFTLKLIMQKKQFVLFLFIESPRLENTSKIIHSIGSPITNISP